MELKDIEVGKTYRVISGGIFCGAGSFPEVQSLKVAKKSDSYFYYTTYGADGEKKGYCWDCYKPSDLAVMEFKVGDKVKITGNANPTHSFSIGDVGEVTSEPETRSVLCKVNGTVQYVAVNNLELVASASIPNSNKSMDTTGRYIIWNEGNDECPLGDEMHSSLEAAKKAVSEALKEGDIESEDLENFHIYKIVEKHSMTRSGVETSEESL